MGRSHHTLPANWSSGKPSNIAAHLQAGVDGIERYNECPVMSFAQAIAQTLLRSH